MQKRYSGPQVDSSAKASYFQGYGSGRSTRSAWPIEGALTVFYKKGDGREGKRRLGDREYDNLAPILDHWIAMIT